MTLDLTALVSENIPLNRHQLLRIIHAMVDGVVVFNAEGIIQLCNPAFEKGFVLPQDAVLGQSLQALFPRLSPDLLQIADRLMASGENVSQEITIRQSPQHRTFLIYAIPIAENRLFNQGVMVFHDITEVKQTEKMRRDFVANVSHELRTPLSAIGGYAETLQEGALKDEAVAQEFIQIIFNHATRLSQLVRDLLDLSKLEASDAPFELYPMELLPVIEKIIQLNLKSLTEKQIHLHYEPPASCPPILGNSTNIEQVLTNLLDNAIKYTSPQGALKIRVIPQEKLIRVDLEDTGIGIEQKHIPRLFERFYRVDKARSRDMGGTGLGLSIVKHIIQSHGGEVWVESEPGKGTTFSFTLQIAPHPHSYGS
jgi:two-component system, OmpR family, phosphate regulon sensor histidine kinase PhoR